MRCITVYLPFLLLVDVWTVFSLGLTSTSAHSLCDCVGACGWACPRRWGCWVCLYSGSMPTARRRFLKWVYRFRLPPGVCKDSSSSRFWLTLDNVSLFYVSYLAGLCSDISLRLSFAFLRINEVEQHFLFTGY